MNKCCLATVVHWSMVLAVGIVPPSVMLFWDRPLSDAGLVLICLVLMIFLSRIDLLEQISIGPLTARLHKKLVEAEEILQKVREVALLISEISMNSVVKLGRWDGYNVVEAERSLNRLVDLLQKLGVSEEDIISIQKEWRSYNIFDYVHAITGGHEVPQNASGQQIEEWKLLRRFVNPPSPEDLQQYLEKHGALTDERRDLIADYISFVRNGKHRNVSEFSQACRSAQRLVFTVGARDSQ